MSDIVESMRAVCGNPNAHRDSIDYALAFGIDEITRLRAEVERLEQRCADWAASYGEKSSDLEDLKRQNAELADARIADGFARYDAVEAARAKAFERAAQIAESLPYITDLGNGLNKHTSHKDAAAAIRAEASKVT